MSTALVVPRPNSYLQNSQNQNQNLPSSTSSKNPTTEEPIEKMQVERSPTMGTCDFEDLELRIEKAVRERDEQWRRHEKSQIQFLQTETSNMLKSLHNEIGRLSNELREEKRKNAGDDVTNERIGELEKQIEAKDSYTKSLEKKVSNTIHKLQEQIIIQSDRIRQLNEELTDRNQTVTHLSQQLRGIKLREAMASSTHRRRLQNPTSSGSPVTSPSSPHRIFPPVSSGLLSASVAVTYPGRLGASLQQKRSNSAVRAPSMPN